MLCSENGACEIFHKLAGWDAGLVEPGHAVLARQIAPCRVTRGPQVDLAVDQFFRVVLIAQHDHRLQALFGQRLGNRIALVGTDLVLARIIEGFEGDLAVGPGQHRAGCGTA